MCDEMRSLFLVLCSVYLIQTVSGDTISLCSVERNNSFVRTRSCSTQILGKDHSNLESCQVEAIPPNSPACNMVFGPIISNAHIGNVRLKPYILNYSHDEKYITFSHNYTVLNITFSNIKWNTMKFRFQRYKGGVPQNHCRNIVISRDVAVNDQSVLYYDCYWSLTDQNYTGQTHFLDFEATDDKYINRGRYYFNIPSASMLNPNLTVEEWKPFTYIEIHTNTMKLHILPPSNLLPIKAYRIEVIKEGDKGTTEIDIVKTSMVKIKNATQEEVYEYSWPQVAGSYYFVVTPLHERCIAGRVRCQAVESPRVKISSEVHQNLNICIASVFALVVAALFAYYIVLRAARRYCCADYNFASGKGVPIPPRILVIYSPANKLHAECVSSFVSYLRSEYGFDIMYDCDISTTSHGDPYIWAEEAFRISTHVLYIVGPAAEANVYNNIYDQPIISPMKDVDLIQLAFLKTSKVTKNQKDVVNVFFEHSTGTLPVETRHDKSMYLLKDWQKLISYLSTNLLPKQQMVRTEKGRCFLEDLKRAKKLLTGNHDNVVIKCEKLKLNPFENKALL